MPTRVAVMVSVALCVIGNAHDTLASPAAPLVVLIGPGDAPATARAKQALASASLRRGSALLDLSTAKPQPPRARLALTRGIDAYVNLKYDDAIKQLNAGIAEAILTGALGLTTTGLSDLFIYRGLAYTQLGNASKAWQDFVRAATIAPARRLDPVRFPPRAVESFGRAVKAVTTAPPATLTLTVAPGCTTWVDGRRVSVQQPLQLSRGEHFVRIDCLGLQRFGARVAIQHAKHAMAPKLQPHAAPTTTRIRALARSRGAQTIVIARVGVAAKTPPTLLLRLLRVDTGKELERGFAPLAGSDVTARVRSALDRLIDRVVTPPPLPRPITIVVEKPVPWYKRGWVWGLASAAITAAVLTPILLNVEATRSEFDLRPKGSLPW